MPSTKIRRMDAMSPTTRNGSTTSAWERIERDETRADELRDVLIDIMTLSVLQ